MIYVIFMDLLPLNLKMLSTSAERIIFIADSFKLVESVQDELQDRNN